MMFDASPLPPRRRKSAYSVLYALYALLDRMAEEVGFDSFHRSKQPKASKNLLLHSMLRTSQTVRPERDPSRK